MGSSNSPLSPLQLEVLREFFAREDGFFLTGGAALAGFHLKHRATDDLDLFTLEDDAFLRGRRALMDLTSACELELRIVHETPGFVRFVVSRRDEGLVVDLVRERVPQADPDKEIIDGVRVDTIREILANKLNTIVSRSEERDLVDLYWLDRSGHPPEGALEDALVKDGACTPANLAWLLSEVVIDEDAEFPGGVFGGELKGFVDALVVKLRAAALPK